jgi:hypothetical protein
MCIQEVPTIDMSILRNEAGVVQLAWTERVGLIPRLEVEVVGDIIDALLPLLRPG